MWIAFYCNVLSQPGDSFKMIKKVKRDDKLTDSGEAWALHFLAVLIRQLIGCLENKMKETTNAHGV